MVGARSCCVGHQKYTQNFGVEMPLYYSCFERNFLPQEKRAVATHHYVIQRAFQVLRKSCLPSSPFLTQ
jgi:hypothetical protein